MEGQKTNAPFLGQTPSHVVLALGVCIGILGTVLFLFVFGPAKGNTDTLVQNPIVNTVPTNPTAPTPVVNTNVKITKEDHILGDINAPVHLVEYSDFECPFCARFEPTIRQIMDEYKGKVAFTYRHYPLTQIHPMAQKSAEASECAGDQKAFFPMHDKLFELSRNSQLTVETIKKAAVELKLNAKTFNDCLDKGTKAAKVQADQAQGDSYGVQGTPATFINGQLVSGALPIDQIKAIINAELAKVGK